ncbi:N-acetylmuramoyl-L-alanine amidase [Verrucomicrobiaceae bacterium 5K15]|uniref:N-acetylmuramoyl-L-alanine amidase n=1 Tax=Oceaniferula flava TaxID=2800421 RepID=A0AAE2S9H3_9BACT|nr:N-acetylmuramoyl-L-alanine amidase [Oceaniferula flavus]MBK1853523.1 N-acetylmuramoyl-L-alanine amidase [Oceaniferula flavus]MBM1134828.1 N-acetylmuramoyl-L-alanine amidase [Oceaniferula flavus]
MAKYFHLTGRALVLIGFIVGLYGCAPAVSPSQAGHGQSLKRDALGHRPGPRGFTTVLIDAGHGGKDTGALGHGHTEKLLAQEAAELLKKKLKGKFKVVMVRKNDRFVDLDDRVAKANRYNSAILVSLHYNSSRSSYVRGPETYYWRVDSYSLARRIQWNMEKVAGGRHSSRGLERRRLRLTRNPKIPCVLVEFGYLSNRREAHAINSASYRDRLVSAVASAIITQQAQGDAGTGRLPRPITKPLSRASDPPGS